jgi:HPt (histidine-containing phosphotransfer) domain-containing protein
VRLSSVLRAHAAPGAQPLRDAGPAPALPEAAGPAAEPAADGTPLLDASRIEELLEMGDGAAVLVKRAVDNFVSRTPETLAELHAAVVACDAEALRAGAHKLKGSALNLGALRVAEVSLALEELGREGSPADGSPLLEDLEESLHDAAVALQPYH